VKAQGKKGYERERGPIIGAMSREALSLIPKLPRAKKGEEKSIICRAYTDATLKRGQVTLGQSQVDFHMKVENGETTCQKEK